MAVSRQQWFRLLAFLLAASLIAAACGDDDDAAGPDADGAAAGEPSTEAPDDATEPPAPTVEPAVVEPTEEATTAPSPAAETSECAEPTPGVVEYELESGGLTYGVRVQVPSSAETEPLPTVLNWHGLGSAGSEQAVFSDYETLAEAEGFLVVHPTGLPSPVDDRNNWELVQFDQPDRDDVAFASALMDDLIARFCADPTRIYSTGMSNGGLFTARLVCELGDRLAAAVSVAGVTHPDSCTASEPVPYLAFHGTDDEVVPFAGGGSTLEDPDNPQPGAADFFEQVMPDEFAEFAADMGCDAEPERTDVSPEVIRYDYTGCREDVPLAFFEIVGGGHTWPGTPLAPVIADTLGFTTDDVDATTEAWDFFQQHQLD